MRSRTNELQNLAHTDNRASQQNSHTRSAQLTDLFIVYDHCNNCQCDRTLCTTVFWKYNQTLRSMNICIFDILYFYPRMYPSRPLSVSITIRINENAHFPDTDVPILVSCMIPEALAIISTMCMILLPLPCL